MVRSTSGPAAAGRGERGGGGRRGEGTGATKGGRADDSQEEDDCGEAVHEGRSERHTHSFRRRAEDTGTSAVHTRTPFYRRMRDLVPIGPRCHACATGRD